jgi:hypothetical protein
MKASNAEFDPIVAAYVAARRELTRQRDRGGITTEELWAALEVLDERFADVRDWRDHDDPGK